MFAYRYNPPKGMGLKELIEYGEKAQSCGADVNVKSIEGQEPYLLVGCRKRNCHEFIECLRKKLTGEQAIDLEHSIGSYAIEFDYTMDKLFEEGEIHKDDNGIDYADAVVYSMFMESPILIEAEE